MKAIVYRTYGGPDVLSFEDAPTPEPAANQVLVRIRAASVNPYDWHFMRGSPAVMRMMTGLARPTEIRLEARAADLGTIAGLIAAGAIAPVIDRRYPLNETADAMRYVEAGHARGKVVVTVS